KPNLFQSTSDLAKDYGAEVLDRFESNGLFQTQGEEILHLKLPDGTSTEQAMQKLSQDPRVAETAPNTIYHLAGEPLKPSDLSPALWGMNNTGQDGGTPDADIDAPEAWATCIGARENGPIIAVLDTGQDYDHPDLKNNLWTNPGETADGTDSDGNGVIDDLHGYNAVLDNGNARAGHGHGTHCAGTIGAEGNNDQGVVGVNWRAQIMPVKIFPDDGDATTAATIIRAVRYADKMGARVTSNSGTGAGYNP
ncbi:MAG: S8 family serine peptidase, partial [Candidatus Eremiobacteraeota bacterium]|nr:S8 family serine peptidase [Candidatus Eremiobacteraeota bacterium]